MPLMQSRRRFLSSTVLAGAAGLAGVGAACLGGGAGSLAAEPPPETTAIRLVKYPDTCPAAEYAAEELLRAEGFTEIRYVRLRDEDVRTSSIPYMIAHGEVDLCSDFVIEPIQGIAAGAPITVLAGLHAGCFELFAKDGISGIAELKNRAVGVGDLIAAPTLLLAVMASYVGLDPAKDINWVVNPSVPPMQLFVEGRIDAFIASAPQPQELHARNIGHVIVNTSVDHPWSQYFCCMVVANTDFVHKHPAATKRALRAILKASDLCATEPARVARLMVDRGFTTSYDYALQTLNEIPYNVWRDYDPEDTLRFYALRLQEAGMIKLTPQKIIAEHTDWRFLNELKRELKA